jgi:hypothetical protein
VAAVNAVQIDALGLPTTLRHEIMDERLELRGQQRVIVFGVPIDMEIDLVEDMTRHEFRPFQEEAG